MKILYIKELLIYTLWEEDNVSRKDSWPEYSFSKCLYVHFQREDNLLIKMPMCWGEGFHFMC